MDIDLERLGKLLAVAGSDQDGEALAALRKARKMMEASGQSFTDLASVMKRSAAATPMIHPTGSHVLDPETIFDATMAADIKRNRDELRTKKEAQRKALIERHGSVEAAEAPCELEQKLLDAVKPWRTTCKRPLQRWTYSLEGIADIYNWKDGAPNVVKAIATAYPMPAMTAGQARCSCTL